MTTTNTTYFINPPVDPGYFEFSNNNTLATLSKKVLVMVEGKHTDSQGRTHVFSAERIHDLVTNTNDFMSRGGQIPWQKDHQKTQDFNIGHLESPLEIRPVSERDIQEMSISSGRPVAHFKHLVGKIGAFASKLVGKGSKVVADIVSGNIGTISPGIDPLKNCLVEISATPIPAIAGLMTYSRDQTYDSVAYYSFEQPNNPTMTRNELATHRELAYFSDDLKMPSTALSWEQLEEEEANESYVQEQYEYLTSNLFKILTNISMSTEDQLQGQDPVQLSLQALDRFNYELEDLFGLVVTEEEQQQQSGTANNTMQSGYGNAPLANGQQNNNNGATNVATTDPEYRKRQQGLLSNSGNMNYSKYSNNNTTFRILEL